MVSFKIGAAPMAGVTDLPFRRLLNYVSGDCIDFLFTEMVSAKGVLMNNNGTKRLLPGEKEKVIVQLFGSSEEEFRYSTEYVLENYPETTGININAACPVKKVIRNGAGSAMVKDIPNLKKIMIAVENITHKYGKKASIKIRKGWNSDINYGCITDLSEEIGMDEIYIHGRTVEQKYSGFADDLIMNGLENREIDIYWSGDIFVPEDAVKIMKKYPFLKGLLVARGMLGNPWIFKDIKNLLDNKQPYLVSAEEKIEVIKKHMSFMLEEHNDYKVAGQFKKFVAGYTHGIRNAREKRHQILQLKSVEDMLEALIEIIASSDQRI